jgi:mono/diheme cytochrome c family protein
MSALAGPARLRLAPLWIAAGLMAMAQPCAAQVAGRPAAAPAPAGGEVHAKVEQGRRVFANSGCGVCHTLSDAGATGAAGPSLDRDPNLSEGLVVERVTNGEGAMPAFIGQMSPGDMAAVAAYVAHAAAR